MRRTFTSEERRARLAVRHRLAPAARVGDDVADIARSVVVLHATDPLTLVVSALVRMKHPDASAVERALFEERTVLRMMGMRRTLFGVSVDDIAMIQAAASDAVATRERARLSKVLTDAGITESTEDGDVWINDATTQALASLEAAGSLTAAELAKAVPALGARITISPGKRYEATVSLASRLLTVIGTEGHVVRGRPRGRWTGSQHHWTTPSRWLPDVAIEPLPTEEAQARLAAAWLARFGPGTLADLKWWTGWNLGTTRAALARLDLEEVDLDGDTGFALADDLDPTAAPEPWVALLPSLDPTIMGWRDRHWYLGDHQPALFDTAGNAGPTIWVDGRAVGSWGQRQDGEIVLELLEDIGADRTAQVEAESARLRAVLGDLVVSFRFTSALGRRLIP